MRRLACSITAKPYTRVPVRVRVSSKSQAGSALAWERRKAAQAEGIVAAEFFHLDTAPGQRLYG